MGRVLDGSFESESPTPMHWLAVLLAVVTGVIHVYAGIVEGRIPVSLAGIGFLGAVVLFLLDYRQPLLYVVGIGYTAVQIPLWYVVKAGEYTMVGYVDKGIQVVFITLLAYLYWNQGRTTATSPEPQTA